MVFQKVLWKWKERNMKITLKAARINIGWTQAKAAEKLGVTDQTLSNWERGISGPSQFNIDVILKVYKIRYDDIEWVPERLMEE